jgi:subtilisin family serine protease
MSCCQPPLALAYIRALLSRRHDIVVYPTDAFEGDTPPDNIYLYRPSEILVPVAQIEVFTSTAKRLGIRFWRIGDCPEEVCEEQANDSPDEAGERQAADSPDEADEQQQRRSLSDVIARYVIGASADLDTVLDRLVRAAPERLDVTPNHVLLTCPVWALSPATEPRVAVSLPDPSEEGPASDVTVAVIDGGLPQQYDENALLDGVVAGPGGEEGWPYRGSDPVLTFPQGHGSFVTGVVRQYAPQARICSYLAADQDGVTDEWYLGRQVDVALEQQPSVVNLSLGAPSRHDESLLGLALLGMRASDPAGDGPIVVAAAGNMGMERRFWPAAEAWAIGVAAVKLAPEDRPLARAWFSDFGCWVDACADGVDVVSSYEARPYRPISDPRYLRYFSGAAIWSGTSFAAPRVSAAVAHQRAGHPTRSREEVLQHLRTAPGAIVFADIGIFVP